MSYANVELNVREWDSRREIQREIPNRYYRFQTDFWPIFWANFLRSGRTYDDMTLRSNAANRHMLDWNNPENFEIKTLSVERQLEQLVKQVTTLVDGKPSNYRKGQSKSGQQLLEVRFENIFWVFIWKYGKDNCFIRNCLYIKRSKLLFIRGSTNQLLRSPDKNEIPCYTGNFE